MHLGRFQLGDFVPINMVATVAGGTPSLPDAAPVCAIFAAGSLGAALESHNLPIRDRYGTTALFGKDILLTSSYAAGEYVVVNTWAHSSTANGEMQQFSVVAGGDALGSVIGQHNLSRPESQELLYQTDAGALRLGKNPH